MWMRESKVSLIFLLAKIRHSLEGSVAITTLVTTIRASAQPVLRLNRTVEVECKMSFQGQIEKEAQRLCKRKSQS